MRPTPTHTVLGLPLVVASTLVVLVFGVSEAWNGLATVADTGTVLTAGLLLIMLVALILRFTGDRDMSWRSTALAGLAVVAVALAALMLLATFRGHTASDRFADRMDGFPLPDAYVEASSAGADTRNQRRPEHVARAWRVPDGDDACAAMTAAFTEWAEPPFEEYTRGRSCTISSDEQAEKAEAHVAEDGSVVVLEMWLEGAA